MTKKAEENKKENKAQKALHDVEQKTEKMVSDVSETITSAAKETKKAVENIANKENMEKTKDAFTGVLQGLKANSHMVLAAVFLFIGIVILRDIIVASLRIAVGVVFIIGSYLLATDFFKKGKKKHK